MTATTQTEAVPLEAKLAFLGSAAAHPGLAEPPRLLETHMSWLVFAGEGVLKLKKPVRYPFLDFSSLAAREFNCREELRLNARLADGVYLGLLALCSDRGRLRLVTDPPPAGAHTVDWLVQMRRLPDARAMPRLVETGAVAPADVDALLARLARFYRGAMRCDLARGEYLARLQREQDANRQVLLRPGLELPGAAEALTSLDAALVRHAPLLERRAREHRIVDGHGDLRPEHVWLLDPPVVIDCLEFNAALRQVDPFDELAFLALECGLAGAGWIGERLLAGARAALGDDPGRELVALHTATRALLRARLAMAHLLDAHPREPERWPPRAQACIDRALAALGTRCDGP